MIRIGDLLARDFSRPVEEFVKVDNDDPNAVFIEQTEYVATDHIKAECERLFHAMAAALKSPNEDVGVWISGSLGVGKSAFMKNIGYVLANREVAGAPASSLFMKHVESRRVTEYVELLNRSAPYEICMFDFQAQLPMQTNEAEQIAEVMYRVLLSNLGYADDHDIAGLETELEKEGKLAAFEDLCRAEYQDDWRKIRRGKQRLVRSSALLHRLDPLTYSSTDTWLNSVKVQPASRLSVKILVGKLFDLCEIRRPGAAFAFIVDHIDQHVSIDGERLGNLCAIVEQFGKESLVRMKAGKIPGPAWVIVSAREKLPDVYKRLVGRPIQRPRLGDYFKHQIEMSPADIREAASRRVLGKKESQEPILRNLFRDHGASLIQNVKLERSSRRTECDEDQFVQFYPYLPHLIDLSIDITTGMLQHPNAPIHLGGSNRTIVKQSFEMLVSERTHFADQPVGVLVSIDKIYELMEGNLPWEKQKLILDIRQRFDDEDYPGMAVRVAKAMCVMEFVKTDLPRTANNIAALLIQRVTEPPPRLAVTTVLYRLKAAQFVRETANGWKLNELDELRSAAAGLESLRKAVGIVNPRPPGWRNDLIQLFKKLLARSLVWHTRPQLEFNTSVSQSIEGIVGALDHLFKNMVALDRTFTNLGALEELSMNMIALEGRLARSEKAETLLSGSMQQQLKLLHERVEALVSLQKAANPQAAAVGTGTDWIKRASANARIHHENGFRHVKTAYVLGLFGTGRQYINELMLQNIGERAKYFRDTIRLHPGPTPMIYSGHATIRHVSRAQESPAVMSRILESVGSGFANSIFVYRHPLDSLLTNWVWWRTYMRDNWAVTGISQVYKNPDDLCAELDENFPEFQAFAEGDPDVFGAASGPRFLSFSEFVEETGLHLQSATLALRLEDFMIDPIKEFSKIVEVMPADVDLSRLSLPRPRTKPYGHLAVQEKVPQFRNFIDVLPADTKRGIEAIGY
jgi:hypothetical protein